MTTKRWQRLEDAFASAMDLAPGARAAFVSAAFPDDASLRLELERLVAATTADDILTAVVGRAAESLAGALDATPVGRRIGPWNLVEEVGAGGMGTVFLAERADEEFDRRVAIKLVRGGSFDEVGKARFRIERQILAGLEHPHIARMLDGGTTDDGLPYVVMEYVEGQPIHTYADANRLRVRERIELFLDVLDAVGYAHRNLVVHRDLKPGNILVTADGTAKLLDFGIAKLLEPGGATGERTLALTTGRLMTPEYASPEQILGESVGTASDVYSAGVLLYRLLAGRLPHELAGRSAGEIERIVRTRDPERPSRAVRMSEPDADRAFDVENVARARRTEPATLARTLEGDLDVILLKALRREPDARYGSAERLADDLRRYLEGLPVDARAPTAAYRTGKFIRRHALGVAAAVAVVVGLAAGLAVALAQARAAERARDDAERSLARSEAVQQYLTGVFELADPRENLGEEISVRTALDRGLELLGDLDGQPEVKADVLETLGTVYSQLGVYETSADLRRQAVVLRRERAGDDPAAIVGALNRLGIAYTEIGRLDSAALAWNEAFERGLATLGPSHDDVLAALGNVGIAYARMGRTAAAESSYRRAIELEADALAPDDPNRTYALNNLGLLLMDRGDFDEAESMFEEVNRIRSSEDSPGRARADLNLGTVLREAGRFDEAEPVLRSSLEMNLRILGREHRRTAESMYALGLLYARRGAEGDWAAADTLLPAAHTLTEAALTPTHEAVGYMTFARGVLASRRGRLDEAERWFDRTLDIRRGSAQVAQRETVKTLIELAFVQRRGGRAEAAVATAREAVALADRELTRDDPFAARAQAALGLGLARIGNPEGANLFEDGVGVAAARFGATHPLVVQDCAEGAGLGLAAPACGNGGSRLSSSTADPPP